MACQVRGTAFITGAASGIGKGTAHVLAKNGITALSLLDVNLPLLESTRDELQTQYPHVSVEILEVNVVDEISVQAAVRMIVEKFGRIDIAVNCAGISGHPTPTDQLSLTDWQKIININQTGVWICQRALIQQMITQEQRGAREGRGVILNIASMFGVGTPPGELAIGPYVASKHAVVGITKMDAKLYIKQGIRINAICPGYVHTPMISKGIEAGAMDSEFAMTPIGRPASVEEIADVILFLTSPMSSYMCGAALVVDGGYTI